MRRPLGCPRVGPQEKCLRRLGNAVENELRVAFVCSRARSARLR